MRWKLNRSLKPTDFLARLLLHGSTTSTLKIYDTSRQFLLKSSTTESSPHGTMHTREWPLHNSNIFVLSSMQSFPVHKFFNSNALHCSASQLNPMPMQNILEVVQLLLMFSLANELIMIFLHFLCTNHLSVTQEHKPTSSFLKWQLTTQKQLQIHKQSQNGVKFWNFVPSLAWFQQES